MKKVLSIIAILAITTGFTACQNPSNQQKDKAAVTEPPKTTVETPKDSTGSNDKQPEKKEETKTPGIELSNLPSTEIDASAVYVGQIDGNSIEVRIDGKVTALFFTDSVKNSFNASMFKKDSNVQVTYDKNDSGQLILTGIRNAANGIAAPGVYVGQIDNNSIEVKIDGKPAAFFLSEGLVKSFNASDFKKGETVRVYYSKNANGQLILTDIHK